jgi:hypothetical protein
MVFCDKIVNTTKTGYMATLFLYLFSFWFHLFQNSHGVHYSVTNIDYSAKTDTISLALKINTEDLELALAHNYDTPIVESSKENNPEIDKQIIKYISTTFIINLNKTQKSNYTFIQRKMLGEDTWVYLSLPVVKELREIEIMQALFFDIYTDQVNLIIFSKDGKEQGMKTTFYDRVIHLKVNSTANE